MTVLLDVLPLALGLVLLGAVCWIIGLVLRLNWGNILTFATMLLALRVALLFLVHL